MKCLIFTILKLNPIINKQTLIIIKSAILAVILFNQW